MNTHTEIYDTIVIGGGQAGLATGYFLKQQGREFVILDANQRIGDAWRKRWDSLRLFTPANLSSLAGMPLPAPPFSVPTKDQMADYLEAYAARFELPVQTGVKVDRLSQAGGRFTITAGRRRFEANHVVVAMSNWQHLRLPAFAGEMAPGIVQVAANAYRNPSQLQAGGVLVVGAGNSGAEIALDVVRSHPTWLSGRDTGYVPIRVDSPFARYVIVQLLFRVIFHRLLTIRTPMGRKARAAALSHGMALVRTKPRDLAAAGVQRVARTVGARDGRPVLEDGRVLDVANIIWACGYEPGFTWIDLPLLANGFPKIERGVVPEVPGLYFVGLNFQYAVSSGQIQGVSRDAAHVVRAIAAQAASLRREPAPSATAEQPANGPAQSRPT
jgi:putative flavoprotein involved in K+ transport